MASSSRIDPFDYMPTSKRIKTTSTSLPSSSSSASPPNLKWTYEVFLSFRGEARNKIVGHLYKNLTDKGIHTFLDNKRLEQGKKISPELLKAIKESRFAIIIFSEDYASSSWCLDELVHIIDCTKKTGQIAYPVFYNVDPSNVRNQKESFAKAFAKHKKKKLDSEKIAKWREALTHAGGLSGWDTRDRSEVDIIEEIVKRIFYKLSRGLLRVDDNLVEMEIHMKEISTCLDITSKGVKFVGIHGLGGIGKTTIAKVLYNRIYDQFEGCSYLANVREKFEKEGNLVSLQKQLLYEILKVQDLQIFDDDRGSAIIQDRLNKKKVLIILDDVDHKNQLEKLAEKGEWFGQGSRIIITTRDQHLLNTYEGVQRYEVRQCGMDKSLELFSWKAFKENRPPNGYMELSNDVVRYTKGLPLALTVLGSHLHKKSKDTWRGAIDQLSVVPKSEINDILKISYEGLEELQKDVFLDIACFFNGEDKEKVMEKLDSFGFYPSDNIPVLIDKSLITVSAKNELMMHDLVRDMGRYIVREESPKYPEKRSRLWNDEDILRVLEMNMATEAIEGIQPNVDMSGWSFKAEAFMEMKNLRFLKSVGYPCEHLALDFPHDKLVYLSLTSSSIKSLWNGRKALLPHLKSIDLSSSIPLRVFPDVTGLPNLERLSLGGCDQLVKIHPSVWVHKGLKFLDLGNCHNLYPFSNKIEMESLETLDLGGCRKMREFPEVYGNMKRLSKLVLSFTAIKELPSSIENFTALKILELVFCKSLVCLPRNICKLEYLEQLDLTGCSTFANSPMASLPSSSSSASPPNLSMASSSSLDPYKDLPIQEIITTAATSLPSSSSSSSASPPNLKWTYDVFLSFRGEDTRNNFVGHLYKNLIEKGINTFRDNEKLERGKEISPELLKAIEESRFAIIIFSENYASSSWCLDELVKIIDCTKKIGQIAYPVFYNVDPSNVRKQKGSFAKAFDEHKKKNLASEKMEKWREALSQAGSLSGWDTRGRHEVEIIQEIVEGIFYRLSRTLPLDVGDGLVGLEIHIKEINTLLSRMSDDVKFIGIWGKGGIGKTTIAKFFYNQISCQFEGCSYLANVREKYEKEGSLVSLQKQLLCEILKVQDLQIFDHDNGSAVIRKRLSNKKVLIILDDVDHVNQLEKLAGNGKWFGPGSIIIITTRDQHLLSNYEGGQRYEVKEYDLDKSFEIFSWKAFKRNNPPEDYMQLSKEVVGYAKGLPLALIVLGSYLCDRSKDAWRGAIEELKIVPNEDVTKILKIMYEGLSLIQKNVFLDIACFFIGEDKDEVMEKLDSFGFFPSINIQVLIEKSLITVSVKNELMMHDLVRDMGWHIVRQESPQNPEKWSRLWNDEDILRVLKKNMATEAIQGIQYRHKSIFDQSFKAEAFMEMENLRFLELSRNCEEHFALDFLPDKLVHLSLRLSSIESLSNGRQPLDLPNLKSIDLSESHSLREFPDVTGLPNLERLKLQGCRELVEIHPSVWVHKGLKFLNLGYCEKIEFPNKIEMESLDTLDLRVCEKMKEFPEVHGNMKRLSELDLSFTAIKDLPSSIENFTPLKILHLRYCKELVCLPSSICKLKYLEELDLWGCYALEKLPENIGDLESLVKLDASVTAIKEVPASIQFLDKLRNLSFQGCGGLKLPSFYGLSSLTELNLWGCNLIDETFPSNIECLSSLETLDLSYNNFESLPTNITQLSLLTKLYLWNCERIKSIPELPSLTHLDLGHCYLTEETFPSNIECLSSLETLNLSYNNFESLPTNITQLSLLTRLDLRNCWRIKSIPEFRSRISINTYGCTSLTSVSTPTTSKSGDVGGGGLE